MLRINFLLPHLDISGGTRIVLGYAHRLAVRGHEVCVICPDVFWKRWIKNAVRYRSTWVECQARLVFVPEFSPSHIPTGDILVATAWQTADPVFACPQKKGNKIYLIQHLESLWAEAPDHAERTYRLPMHRVVVSHWLQDVLMERFQSESTVVLNAVDFRVFFPERTRNNQAAPMRICMLHHPYEWKGVADGLKAFSIAKQQCPDIQLIMFSAHSQRPETECEFHYRPSQEHLRSILNSCDIFLCPSWYEGFGLPALEAMACQCALITTDTGGSRNYAIHERTALVSKPRDAITLASNLVRMVKDQSLRRSIASRGYEKAREFGWDKAVSTMERLFLNDIVER